MSAAPIPPAGYPTLPGFFRDHDLPGLELQYEFYYRAYPDISPDDLPNGTRARVLYLLAALAYQYRLTIPQALPAAIGADTGSP